MLESFVKNKMQLATQIAGLILIALGLITFGHSAYMYRLSPLGHKLSFTPLIPAVFGSIFLILGILAKSQNYKRVSMHAVVILAAIGEIIPWIRLVKMIQRIGLGLPLNPIAIASLIVMIVVCGSLFLLCVYSFQTARRGDVMS